MHIASDSVPQRLRGAIHRHRRRNPVESTASIHIINLVLLRSTGLIVAIALFVTSLCRWVCSCEKKVQQRRFCI